MKLDDLDIDELSRGVCSKSNLYRVRNGERDINAVFFYHIIRRLFLSPERFQIMIDSDEYAYFSWIYKVKSAISGKRFEELSELASLDQEEALHEFQPVVGYEMAAIHGALFLEMQSYSQAAYKEFKKSVEYMLGDDRKLIPGRYGIDELNRYMNYLKLSVMTQHLTEEDVKAEFDRIHRIAELRNRDPREEAKLYPRIVCFTLNTIGDEIPLEIQKEMVQKALGCLRRTHECYDLPELLRLLIDVGRELQDPEISRYIHWYESICTAFKIAGYDTEFNWYDSHDGACQLYLIHEYLKRSRIGTKDKYGKILSQEKASEFIMDPANYSRVESGKYRPRRQHYEELTKRMGVRSDLYRGEIITDDPEIFSLLTESRRAANDSDAEKLDACLKLLSENLDKKYVENIQFLALTQLDLDEITGKITLEETVQRLIDILEYTTPYQPDENHVFSYLEAELVYKIVRNKRYSGLLTDTDVLVLRGYLKSEEKSQALFWERSFYIKRLLAGILQTRGDLDEAEKLSTECISDMLKVWDAGILTDCLDVLAESIVEKDRDYAETLVKAAFWLCDLYHDEDNKQAMSRYHFRVFGTGIED